MPEEVPIPQEHREYLQRIRHIGAARLLWKRLLIDECSPCKKYTDERQQDKGRAPIGKEQNLSADDGRNDRCKSIHHHKDGKEARQLRPLTDITRNRTRNDDAARPCKARTEAEKQEEIDILREDAAKGRSDKDQHADKEWSAPPKKITQWTRENLPKCHAERRHRQCQLHE